ncbi:MAG: universal stress protein [Methanosarcinaceae archaeon]|nr:universal stress protein [Methanosarcinaceae archaeon]
MYRNILIAMDGSKTALKAAKHGINIAKSCGAKVYAMNVIDFKTFSKIPKYSTWARMYEQSNTTGLEILSYVDELGKAAGVAVEKVVLEGNPAQVIVNFASGNSIDLIVIGTVGLTGWKHALLGSVAEKVVRTSICPVTVVPEGFLEI